VGCDQLGFNTTPVLDMDIPDSLQGEKTARSLTSTESNEAMALIARGADVVNGYAPRAGLDGPCSFRSVDDGDMFANGYSMTRFMVSAVSSWTCISDTLITIADKVEHNGDIIATDNVKGSETYDSEEPTHYSVTDDSDDQTTVRMYYGFSTNLPPTEYDAAAFYMSWTTLLDDTEGKLIIDANLFEEPIVADDPVQMRLDFDFSADTKTADMFLKFDDNNSWAEGYRIAITKDLTADITEKVFEAKGLLAMTSQFIPVDGIDELPDLSVYTVSNQMGDGAAIAMVSDLTMPLEISDSNHVGNYLTTKEDIYYFNAQSDWDYINKTFTTATLEGGRTTPATGGTWLLPFNPSLDMIAAELELGSSYFTGTECANIGDECAELINAVVQDGFAGQEQNQGSDPMDWRSTEISAPVYLESVFPNGLNWDGAFDQVFYP
jgi:hypothetical protein